MIDQKEPNPDNGQRTLTILIADEDEMARRRLAAAMESHGCDVVTCPDGVRLLDALNTFIFAKKPIRFDVVLCDLHISGIRGVDLLRGMQDYIGFPPIILMSDGKDQALDAMACELGAAMVLRKPVDMREVVTVIDRQRPLDCRPLAVPSA